MSDFVDDLKLALSTAPSRRAVMRGLVGAVGTVGLAATFGEALDAEAKKKNKKRRQRRRKKKNQQCTNKKPCATPLNPCEVVNCKKHKCKTSLAANGTACGAGLVCETGACVCPDGLCNVYVTAPQQQGWVGVLDSDFPTNIDFQVDNSTNVLTFVAGPGSPLYGAGSVEFSVFQNDIIQSVHDKYLTNYFFQGVPLSDITQLAYSTYQPSSNPGATTYAPQLVINVDFFGPGSQPTGKIYYSPGANGLTVAEDTWQEWDAIEANGGALWTFDGAEWPDSADAGTDPRTWAQILSAYPNARIDTNNAFVALLSQNLVAITGGSNTFVDNIGSFTFGAYDGVTRYVFSEAAG